MSDENKVVRVVYTFFLGLIIAIFVGVGINTFYEGPKEPTWETVVYEKEPTEQQLATEKANEDKRIAYETDRKPYARNVSIIALISSVLLLVGSLIFQKRIKFITDGVMMGGLFTLFYSIIRSFESSSSKYQFIAVSVGLLTVAIIGFKRFVSHNPSTK